MKIGYFDCFSGISGDMCLGALVDAGVPLSVLQEALAGLPVHGFALQAEKVVRAGIAATKVDVVVDHHEHHPHRGLHDVLEIIDAGGLDAGVAERSAAVFRTLAEAEAKVHNTDVDSVHFHEVGAVDAICDIVGTVVGLRELGLEAVRFGTIRLGGGTVKAAHGTLPVPAPATAELVKGLPTAGGPVDMELTTPTGAAILRALGEPSPGWPDMVVESVGYGAGGRDLHGHPNVLRLALGECACADASESDAVWVLEVNLDDMTGEEVGFCTARLMEAGALDVFTTPVQMKKNRPGLLLAVLCPTDGLKRFEELLWRHTSTLGIRRALWQRSKLARESRTIATDLGEARVKLGRLGGAVVRCEPEYEDCARIAAERGLPLRQVYEVVRAAARAARP